MTNEERLYKLNQAERLIREVEFSYPQDDYTRRRIYKVVVETFSFLGSLHFLIEDLNEAIKQESTKDYSHVEELDDIFDAHSDKSTT